MSNAKFAAVKELIKEEEYEAARAVLETMEDPKAGRWLEKLDEIDPPFPTKSPTKTSARRSEQERFYRNQNRDRRKRRAGDGIELIGLSIASFLLFAFFAYPNFTHHRGTVILGLECFLLPLGVIALLGGLRLMSKD